MPFWSVNFEWLGYGSINFIDGMGSISILALVKILEGLIAFCLLPVMGKIKSKYIKKRCGCKEYFYSTLKFLNGTFFEILVCVSISMSMFKFKDFFNTMDWVSVLMSFFFAALLITRIIFVVYFTIFKTKHWVNKIDGERTEKLGMKKFKEIHNSILDKKSLNKSDKNIDAELIKMNKFFMKRRKKRKMKI